MRRVRLVGVAAVVAAALLVGCSGGDPEASVTPSEPRTVAASGPNVTLPVVGSAWQLPGYAHPDFAVLEVLDAILATGDHSRLDTALVIHPREFESDYRKYDGMTLNELDDYIKTLKARGSTGVEAYEVEKYTRYSAPFTILILVFMGVIVSSRKSRGGTGLQIAVGFILSFIFILFFTLFRTFAEAGSTPPELSVWIPNIIFAIISLGMYKYVPR